MTLDEFNALDEAEAQAVLTRCCVSTRWLEGMLAARPFTDKSDLHDKALRIWESLSMPDFLEAFKGHPKIGNVDSLRAKYADTRQIAAGEQSGVNEANEAVLNALAKGNDDYEKRFGFIFIVCASGKSASEMLALLEARLENDLHQELVIAAGEQAKITALRLDKVIDGKTHA